MWEKILQKKSLFRMGYPKHPILDDSVSPWKLEENTSSWIIFFEIGGPECEFEFGRLLNDFSLREKLHHQTGQLRDAIISKVLRSIDDRLGIMKLMPFNFDRMPDGRVFISNLAGFHHFCR